MSDGTTLFGYLIRHYTLTGDAAIPDYITDQSESTTHVVVSVM
jgi:hypothetical protein